MLIGAIDFPRSLIEALRNDQLVIFAGAGVSMGSPANRPDFGALADQIAAGTALQWTLGDPIDRFLGQLEVAGVDVRGVAASILNSGKPRPHQLHRDILRLFLSPEQVRIVTTNFDPLFERALPKKAATKLYVGPALPLGRNFRGIVHVHGSTEAPEGMVLTDGDFGRAYLTDGWARRFILELFRTHTVLFVGYSHDDTVMKYLARALPASEGKRFALDADGNGAKHWEFLGIVPVFFQRPSPNDYSRLYSGVSALADFFDRGIFDWQSVISRIVTAGIPQTDDDITDLSEAISDLPTLKIFVKSAMEPHWVDWADKRGYLDRLFGVGDLEERDVILMRWLTDKFARSHSSKLHELLGRRNLAIHPAFWRALAREVSLQTDPPVDRAALAKWLLLLVTTVPRGENDHTLLSLMEAASRVEDHERVVRIFELMIQPKIELRDRPTLDEDGNAVQRMRFDIEIESNGWCLQEAWKRCLEPFLPHIAHQAYSAAVRHIAQRFGARAAWEGDVAAWDTDSWGRSAIEPHQQDELTEPLDFVINVARDCLEYLISANPSSADSLCGQLSRSKAPILRRLSIHAQRKR